MNGECVSFAVISDYLHHDKYFTIIAIKRLLELLLRRFPAVSEINFFSDLAALYFRQRFFYNSVTLLPKSLGIDRSKLKISLDFFATSHGKGAVDGVGGTVKRQVMSKVMCRKVIVKTSLDYTSTASKICPNVYLFHIRKEEVEAESVLLDQGTFSSSIRSLHGIRGIHHMEVTSQNQVEAQ